MNLNLEKLPLFKGLTLDEVQIFFDNTKSLIRGYDIGTRILKAHRGTERIGVIVRHR